MRRRAPVPAAYVVLTTTRRPEFVAIDLAETLRVLDSGVGTVEDPEALWFELTERGARPAIERVREVLTPAETLRAHHEVVEGEGKDLARQIPLLGAYAGGLWRDGLPCGPRARLMPQPREERPAVEQMPLFDEM